MTIEEKIRSLLNPRLRQIHASIGGILSMGDLAVYVGQPMSEAMAELAEFVACEAALAKPTEGAKDEHGFWPHCGCDTHAQHLDRVKEKPTEGAPK